jgi:uncharacterized protein YabE (DUF348 family)
MLRKKGYQLAQKYRPYVNRFNSHPYALPVSTFLVLFFLSIAIFIGLNATTVKPSDSRIIELSIDNTRQSLPTRASTVGEFIKRANIKLGPNDIVEPDKNTVISGDDFKINVYRARPVTIIDQGKRIQAYSAATTPRSVAAQVGITVYPEDRLDLEIPDNFLRDGVLGEKVVIERSTFVYLNLYGSAQSTRTHARTVGDLLDERGVKLASDDNVSPVPNTPISANMQIFVTRPGVQVVTREEEIPMPVEEIRDDSLSLGARAMRQQGAPGKRLVTFQVQLENGQVSQHQIQSVVVQEPVKQIVAVGTRPVSGLTKAKGVFHFTDSNGVTHRETYYDLPMNGVMRACGGTYSVRPDGVKVDQDGYILVAANLRIYPRCSVVETSLGAGKVYDTGGFATHHPHGFDLATDWSNNDGH